MKGIQVRLGRRSYPVFVGDGILNRTGMIIRKLGCESPPVVVSNRRVLDLHAPDLLGSLEKACGSVSTITVGDGERFKNSETVRKVYDALFRARADRRTWIVAFGGGVVGDIAGFAAATYMRGIAYVSVPTTLLAQVDSSIGGKVGINVRQGKNLIGAFHQPRAVVSDIRLLRTLPRRELASGLYEILKCGAIRSERLFRYLERRLDSVLSCDSRPLQHVVREASGIKAEVVSGDETEEDLRMILNFGHTVGHALEAATEYRRFRHGEAVGWGMVAAAAFGREMGFLHAHEARRLVTLIHRVSDLPSLAGIRLQAVWGALERDKKFRSGRIRMVLLPRLGESLIQRDIDPGCLRSFLARFLQGEGALQV